MSTGDERCRFDSLERVIRAFAVTQACCSANEAGCVDRLDLTGFVELGRESKEGAPAHHLQVFHAHADGDEIGGFNPREVEFGADSRHFVKYVEQLAVGKTERLSETV
jgi:hypothetical protein